MSVAMEVCANCTRTIGKLEPAHVYKNKVVCEDCYKRLRPQTLPYASSVPAANPQTAAVAARCCPTCGSTKPPIRKSKGSTLLLVILLLFWLLPGLLYLVIYGGYVYVCPDCGYKFGDAT